MSAPHDVAKEGLMTQQSNVMGMAVVLLLASATAARATTGQAAAPGGTADRGATVYAAQKCSMCHALDGRGMAKGPLDGVGSKLSAEDIRQWIVNPAEMTAKANATRKPAMRAYPNLPKEDLDALVAFLHAKKKTP
jgi:mono/diheme cytochrome c family protein